MATWRKLIGEELDHHGETWSGVIRCTLSDEELDREFDAASGSAEGEPFTVWTCYRVYFPTEYDGAEDCASVPRNPCDEATSHI